MKSNRVNSKKTLVDKTNLLTEEQVQAALISLISDNQEKKSLIKSRKRYRKKSEENPRKKCKTIYDEILLSNLSQTNTIVLATSALNAQQMVSRIPRHHRMNILSLETSQKICSII